MKPDRRHLDPQFIFSSSKVRHLLILESSIKVHRTESARVISRGNLESYLKEKIVERTDKMMQKQQPYNSQGVDYDHHGHDTKIPHLNLHYWRTMDVVVIL